MNAQSALLAILAGTAATPLLADVNVYTTRQPELIQPVIDGFTASTGILVNLAFVEEGLVERLVAEGDRSPADLVMTVDIANLQQIVDAGVVQPVDSAVLDAAIPASLRSPDDLWFALTSRARIVYASKERVAAGDVTTYEDLADPKWAGRICTRSGTHNYNLALLSAVIAHHGEEYATTWAAGLKSNLAQKPQGGDRDQVRSIWAGECDISLGHVNVSGIAMTVAAPNHDEALELMEYLVSPEAQAIYAEVNHEYPVLEGAGLSDLVESWGPIAADDTDLTELASHRAAALRIMEEVNFDG